MAPKDVLLVIPGNCKYCYGIRELAKMSMGNEHGGLGVPVQKQSQIVCLHKYNFPF